MAKNEASGRSTLLRQPPDDPSKAPLENALELTELGVLGPVRVLTLILISFSFSPP